ncbi:MAG TPA: hypothetical protein VES95_02285 [Dermatophilaceae bacterium]|nr:hypothetical protein [Dermatophilaceae bacterium]
MAVPSTFRLVRAEDHVVLDVTIGNLLPFPVTPTKNQPSPAVLKAPPRSGDGTLRVRFQAQQIVEFATPATGARTIQSAPILAAPTQVVVRVPQGDPGIPLSVAGILGALARLPLQVSDSSGTRFAFPHLLALRPHQVTTRLSHVAPPVQRAGRSELWHTELVQPAPDRATPGVPVLLDHLASGSTNPGWNEVVTDDLILNALRLDRCDDLAKASQPAGGAVVPAAVNRLRMSGLGGWLDLRGTYPPDFPEYHHKVDMGRDRAQKVVETGVLYPFGHTAVSTSTTTRFFETSGGAGNPTGRAAALASVSTLAVTTPTVTFPLSATGAQHRAWPWESVTIVDAVTPAGILRDPKDVPADLLGHVRVFTVAGQPASPGTGQPPSVAKVPYAYSCVAVDRTGRTSTFSIPMIFVTGDVADDRLATLLAAQGTGFTDIALEGQPLGVAPATGPGAGSARAAAASPASAQKATTVLARKVRMRAEATGRPVVETITGRVEALERYANTGPTEVALSYAKPYLDELFTGANEQGKLFLQLAKGTAVDMAKEATAGLASVALPAGALSRELGAVSAKLDGTTQEVASRIAALARGDVDLSFLEAADLLLGFVPLDRLIPTTPTLKVADTQRITTTLEDGVATTTMFFCLPLLRDQDDKDKPLRFSYVSLSPWRRDMTAKHDTTLTIDQTTKLDTATGAVTSTTVCTITSVALQVHASEDEDDVTALVTVPFPKIVLTSKDGDKPELDVDLGPVRFGGFLAFLGVLADLVDQSGFLDPPALTVDDTGITSSFEFPIPSVAVGVFALENISFGTKLKLPFTAAPPRMSLSLAFARREDPFVVTVAALGGGGYLEIELDTGGLRSIAATIEFGARLAIDLVVAKAAVEAMGGVYGKYIRDVGIDLLAYFRIHGELEVLSLVSVSVTFTLSLQYIEQGNVLHGKGEIAVNVTVLFFSETVVVPIERTFAGQNADPTFAELMAPEGTTDPPPWDTYCLAFAAA